MFRLPLCVSALVSLAVGAFADEKTDLQPLVIEHRPSQSPAKYSLRIAATFGPEGMRIKTVHSDSPLRRVTRPGVYDRLFEVERDDVIVAIRNGVGQFVAPRSIDCYATIVNSLSSPTTQFLIRDLRGTGSWIYKVDFVEQPTPEQRVQKPPLDSEKKIVVVLIGDTHDKNVGEAVKETLNNTRLVFGAESKHLRYNPIEITGKDFSRQNILNRLNSIAVGPNDTLFCYINCHGAFDPKQSDYSQGHFFQMPTAGDFRRRDLRQALELKGARLACLISESCNKFSDYRPTFPVSHIDRPKNRKFESLFLDASGYVNLNSSSTGEYSFTHVFGPMFTTSLRIEADSGPTTWKTYVSELREGTAGIYERMRQTALNNPKVEANFKAIVRNQRSQTVKDFVVPR